MSEERGALEEALRGSERASTDAQRGAILGEIAELRGLSRQGRERGYLTFEQIAATLEEVEVTKEQVSHLHAHLIEHGVDVIAEDGVSAYKEAKARGRRAAEEARARPDGRAEPRLAAPLPALDRPGRAAHRRAGGRAREADRARRHGRRSGRWSRRTCASSSRSRRATWAAG